MSSPGKVGIVGPCTAGKSTLVAGLRAHGYQAGPIAQEHSFVPDMWQRLSKPAVLIFLDVSYEGSLRRKKINWTVDEYAEQQHRLRHARQHADFYLQTDELSIEEVRAIVVNFLEA